MLTFIQYLKEASGPNKPTKAELVAIRQKQHALNRQGEGAGYRAIGHRIPDPNTKLGKIVGMPSMSDDEFYRKYEKGGFNPHLWYIHPGKNMVMKQFKGAEGMRMVHSSMKGYYRGTGKNKKGPAYQGRVDHNTKSISIASGINIENTNRRFWGMGLIKDRVLKKDPMKVKLAKELTTRFPGYTVHDSDNKNEPIF